LLADAASNRATLLPFPVPLNPPPIPGLDRLSAYCNAKFGENLSVEAVRRLIGEYALDRDVSRDEARAASLQDAADTLARKPCAARAPLPSPLASPIVPASGKLPPAPESSTILDSRRGPDSPPSDLASPPPPPSRSSEERANSTIQQAAQVPTPPAPSSPTQYLWNWREILDALDMKNNDENQRRVRDANRQYGGPIILPPRGGQPKVSKAKLLEWWNHLEIRFLTEVGEDNTQASLQAQYEYGKEGTVLPDISGHVKKRRRKKGER
jgi:hypothetical protein